ncbi:hypothetical protein EDB83DRAFT_2433394 [Lactarius deliciosus]|nr:hypothetical protein EDB83DRAFT_2433394 [Lactarius deliciosus]
MVPSPRITHTIPPAPAPSPYRPPAPPPPAHDQWSQPQQVQVYSMSSQHQQQQHGSPPITINVFATPQQGQTLLPPGNTPGPVHAPVLPTPGASVTNDDDDASGEDDTVGHDDHHHNRDRDHNIRQPTPIRIPNTPCHLVSTMISISSPRPALSALHTSNPLPQLPISYHL